MADLSLVTYCGLYCDLCAQRGRIPRQAAALKESMTREGYDSWGVDLPGFAGFWSFLTQLTDPAQACPGCRQGGGYPACQIRACARARAVDVCALCAAFPCAKIEEFSQTYPTIIADGRRLKAIGVEAWIAEQRQRCASGFTYADIRCPH